MTFLLFKKMRITIFRSFFLFLFIGFFITVLLLFYFFQINWHGFIFFLNWFNFVNINYSVTLDSLSFFFVLLTVFLLLICVIISWNAIFYKHTYFFLMLLLTQIFIINFFLVTDLFLFFLFFECILLPMYLLIGVWGSNLRKIYASYQFFFFTFFGSIFMFLSILSIYLVYGTTDFTLIQIYAVKLTGIIKLLVCSFFLIAFLIKIPVVPFHFWLPEAHVEAPTSGSVILAGLLLKLGAYGLIRFLIPVFNDIIVFLNPILVTVCIYSIIYVSFIILRQLDLKRIIAYSSIVHMNFILLGLIILNKNTIIGGIFLLISHGIVSSALFICIGFLYERYHTRVLLYYKGICIVMPLYTLFFFIFILANASLPGTSNFVGEFLVILGIFEFNKFLVFFLLLGLFYSALINFWLYNKMMFGDISRSFLRYVNDISLREITVLLIFTFACLWLGYYPVILIAYFKYYVFLNLVF